MYLCSFVKLRGRGGPQKKNANRKKCPKLTFQITRTKKEITRTTKKKAAPLRVSSHDDSWAEVREVCCLTMIIRWYKKKNGVEGTPTSSTLVCLLVCLFVFHMFSMFLRGFWTQFFFQSPGVGWGFPTRNLDVFLKGDFLRIGIPWDSSPSMPTIWENMFWFTFSKHPTSKPKEMIGFGGIFVGEDPELHWRVGKNHHKRILSQAGQPLNCWGITNLVPGTLKEHNEPFINGCFNWKMEPNLYIGNGWKSPNIHFKLGCLGFCGKPHIGKTRKRI